MAAIDRLLYQMQYAPYKCMYTQSHTHTKTRVCVRERRNSTFNEAIIVAGASGAAPRPDGNPGDYRAEAKHVEASITFVAQQKLVGPIAGAAFLASQTLVIFVIAAAAVSGLRHTLGHPHDLLHRPVLFGRTHVCRSELLGLN